MKFRLEKIREIEGLRCETSRRALSFAADHEKTAKDAVADSKQASLTAAAERDGSVDPGRALDQNDLFERDLLAARVAKARRILAGRVVSLAATAQALESARLDYTCKRRRKDGLDRVFEKFEHGRDRLRQKAEEDDADDLITAARRA